MSKTLMTVNLLDATEAATGENDRGTWKRHSLLLGDPTAEGDSIPVFEADTFADNLPPVGSKVRVVIENRKRIVGQQVYQNTIVTRFLPA